MKRQFLTIFWKKKNFLQSYQTRILAKIVQKKPKNFKNHQKSPKNFKKNAKGKQRVFSFIFSLFHVNDRAQR